jgi:ABC-type glycerol-3-phosphate transport system substrate-binding protein
MMQSVTRAIGIGYLLICLLALLATAFVGPIGPAPFPLPIGPAQEPVVVTIWYGTEKRQWFEDAAQRFAATNPRVGNRPIQVVLRGIGSRELSVRAARREFGGDGQPTVISPASSMWVEVARTDWAALNRGAPSFITENPGQVTPLALTPLVAVIWQERAQLLWPQGPENFWQNLHAALTDKEGWIGVARARGFAPDSQEYQKASTWGFVKFGHTSPLTSNSGAQALILMAYGYYNKSRGLTNADVLTPEFQQWMRDVEMSVLEFGDSTGSFMTSMVQFGPSKYDLVLVYENLALENIVAAQNRWGDIRIYYPPATMFSDHPYAILNAPWVTPEQRQAAEQFRNFLLSPPIQEIAFRQYGFRPAIPDVPVLTNDPSNPFVKYSAYGAKVDTPPLVETPSGEVVTELLNLWRRQINR